MVYLLATDAVIDIVYCRFYRCLLLHMAVSFLTVLRLFKGKSGIFGELRERDPLLFRFLFFSSLSAECCTVLFEVRTVSGLLCGRHVELPIAVLSASYRISFIDCVLPRCRCWSLSFLFLRSLE